MEAIDELKKLEKYINAKKKDPQISIFCEQ